MVMNYAVVILGWLVILACTICVFIYRTEEKPFQIAAGALLILILLIVLINTTRNLDSLKIHGIFLSHSTRLIC